MTEETAKLNKEISEKLTDEIITGYNKFLVIRKGMDLANKKYRSTEHGMEMIRKQHRIWVNLHKDNEEYRNNTNMKQRERYQKSKMAKQLLNKDISLGEKQESLGEIIE